MSSNTEQCSAGQDGIQALMRQIDEDQENNRRVLQTLTPLQLHRLERRLLTGRWPVSHPRVDVAVAAPRRQGGPSGRPRAQASGSSAASGDSGDDPDPPSRAKPGAERLLKKVALGLDDDVLPHAAALVLALDRRAR
jgi:hypothetical protein